MHRELLHPDLQAKSSTYLLFHSTFPFMYFYSEDDRIAWYGDVKMYCTPPLYAAWVKAHPQDQSDIVIGPQ